MARSRDTREYSRPRQGSGNLGTCRESAGHLKENLSIDTAGKTGGSRSVRLERNIGGQARTGTGNRGLFA